MLFKLLKLLFAWYGREFSFTLCSKVILMLLFGDKPLFSAYQLLLKTLWKKKTEGKKPQPKLFTCNLPYAFLHINALMHTVNQLLWKNTWNTRLIKSLALAKAQILMNWRGACALDWNCWASLTISSSSPEILGWYRLCVVISRKTHLLLSRNMSYVPLVTVPLGFGPGGVHALCATYGH